MLIFKGSGWNISARFAKLIQFLFENLEVMI